MGCGSSRNGAIAYRPVTMDSFRVHEVLGKGTFGKVCMVERKSDHKMFALKYSQKEKALNDKAVNHIIQERNMLEEIRQNFICGLRYSFQDDEYLYMVLDLMRGGDMRFHIKSRIWGEDEARTVIAELSSALRYLHSLNIVHRDIKPDNVLLDEAGHAHLSDFNVAIRFIEGKPLKSVAGTEPYMAPEIITGTGYYSAVDWWSLGVMLFEIVCGERPFRSKMRRELIKRAKYKFPDAANGLTDACRSLISGFLQLEPKKRLGHGFDGLAALHNHLYFSGMSWTRVENKAIKPVFIPSISDPNFKTDATADDLNEFLSHKRKPLPEKALLGSAFQDFSYFDYTLFKERPTIAYVSAGSLRSIHVDTGEYDATDRVNTSFETSNSSGVSKWMSLSSQLSLKRRNSKASVYAGVRRRHSTVSHKYGKGNEDAASPASISGVQGTSPVITTGPAATAAAAAVGAIAGSPGGVSPLSLSSTGAGTGAGPSSLYMPAIQGVHGVHLSPLARSQQGSGGGGSNGGSPGMGASNTDLSASMNIRRRHTINTEAKGNKQSPQSPPPIQPLPPLPSSRQPSQILVNPLASPAPSALHSPTSPIAASQQASSFQQQQQQQQQQQDMGSSGNGGYGLLPVFLVRQDEHSNANSSSSNSGAVGHNHSLKRSGNTPSPPILNNSDGMRSSRAAAGSSPLSGHGASIDRTSNMERANSGGNSSSITGNAAGQGVGAGSSGSGGLGASQNAPFAPHLLAELPHRSTTKRRHSYNAPAAAAAGLPPLTPEPDAGGGHASGARGATPGGLRVADTISSVQSLAVQRGAGIGVGVSDVYGLAVSDSSRISGKSSSILASSHAKFSPEDTMHGRPDHHQSRESHVSTKSRNLLR